MKRTLMAVGIAVLVSMLFAPHRHGWDLLEHAFYVSPGADPGGLGYVPRWCENWHWFPAFWLTDRQENPVLLTPFLGQTAFLAVLAAVLVNLGRRKTK
jgi:hypothetical protein